MSLLLLGSGPAGPTVSLSQHVSLSQTPSRTGTFKRALSHLLTLTETETETYIIANRDIFDGPLADQPYSTAGKTITKIECVGWGSDAQNGLGGGGGAYVAMLPASGGGNLPDPMPDTLYFVVETPAQGQPQGQAGWVGVGDTPGATNICSAENGLSDGSAEGGTVGDSIGDVLHAGGDGGDVGGGRSGTATADGASNSPGGTNPGDGGDPPSSTGRPGRIIITYT